MEGLIDTRNEYIEHIQDILSVAISKRIYAIYTEMMEEKKGLKGFQNELYSIRKWNNNIVSDEYKKIVKYTKCKYLSNLIKIIIITTIKIKIYEYREQFDNIKIKIPNPEDFVHKCYINAASFSWKNAYLYNRNNIKDAEYQNNLNLIEENIRAIIKKTFRDFVPFDEIFKQIEDNLTGNVKQFKDTGDGSGASEGDGNASDASGSSEESDGDEEDEERVEEVVKKTKKTNKTASIEKVNKNAKKAKEDSEESDGEEENSETDDVSKANASEDEEEDEEDEENEEDEDEDEEDEDEDEEDEEEEEEEEEEDEEDDGEDSETDPVGEKKMSITVLKEQEEPEYSKINNIVDIPDIPLTKISNEVYNKQPQEILFKAFSSSEQTNKQEEESVANKATYTSDARDTSEAREAPDNIRKEWNSIKDDYNSLSQENTAYKKRDENETPATAAGAAGATGTASGKYENDDDDAISVVSVASARSVASNITDISMIKKIHIKEASNKTKKPSFF
jgi:hypothetical protein